MAFVIWNPAWETGNRQIDDEHRQLLAQIELLFSAIQENRPGERVVEVLAFLSQYVETHFSHEERQMEFTEYSGLARHRAIHDDMRIQVARLIETSKLDPSAVTEDVVTFLTEWLVGHIAEEDQQMTKHLHWFEARGSRT